MDVGTFVETTFDDGETRRRKIVRHRRAPDELGLVPQAGEWKECGDSRRSRSKMSLFLQEALRLNSGSS
jgi:hypothetical protein